MVDLQKKIHGIQLQLHLRLSLSDLIDLIQIERISDARSTFGIIMLVPCAD
jgi:hypothetical protein